MSLARAALVSLLASLGALAIAGSVQTTSRSLKVSEIDRWIDRIERDYEGKRLELDGKPTSEFEEGEEWGLDFIRSLRYHTFIRSYPYDDYDPENYKRGVETVQAMPQAPRRLSPNNSQWEFVGPKNLDVPYRTYFGTRPTSGRVNGIVIDPTNGQRMFLAAAGGGAWRTTDGGANWVSVGDGFEMQNTQCIALDPRNPNTVYVGTGDFNGFEGYPFGLKRSRDGGDTWETLGASTFGNRIVTAVLVDPADSDTIFVSASTRGGDGYVWKTTNGGASWSVAINVQTGWYNLKLGAADANGKRGIWAVANGNNPRIYRSRDMGLTWEACAVPFAGNGSQGVDIAPSTLTPGVAYVLSGQSQAIWKTTNWGDSWTNVTNNHPGGYNWSQSWYDWQITASHANGEDVVYTGLIDLVQSRNGGNTWASVGLSYTGGAVTHNDQHCAAVDPSNPNRIVFGNDGGVYELIHNPAAGSSTITGLSKTLGITQFYDADWHPSNPDVMLGGTQDNATPVALGDLENWSNKAGGDGFQVWICPTNPLIQYATIYNCTIIRTTNGWNSQQDISPNLSDPTPFVTPVEGDPNDTVTVYTGNAWLHRYRNGSWTQKLGGTRLGASSNDHISAIKIAQGDSNRIYVATQQGRLWMTSDGGNTWRDIRNGLPNRSITNLDINPDNKADLLVTFAGFGTGHVYRTTNAEADPVVWLDRSGVGTTRLPDVPANAITRHWEDAANKWFVGTDIGIFATEDAGQTWVNFSEGYGFPNARTTAIKAVPGTAYLNAATYGRGMWRISIASGAQLEALAIAPTSVVGGTTATGTVTLNEPAEAPTVVTLTSSNPAATVPPSVTVPTGQATASFSITTTPVGSNTNVSIQAAAGLRTRSANVTVLPPGPKTVTLNPTAVYGGYPSTATVELDGPAPAGGRTLNLSSNQPAATVPATVTVPAGQTKATFTVSTTLVNAQVVAAISAATIGNAKNANLTVRPILVNTVSLLPNVIKSGGTSKGTVTLVAPAPPGGLSVSLTSTQPLYATVPPTLTFPAGVSSRPFTVTAAGTNVTRKLNITATRAGVAKSALLTIERTGIVSITAPAGDKAPGTKFNLTVTLDGSAPTEGTVVAIKSSNASILSVPSSVKVAAGSRIAYVLATVNGAKSKTPITISATLAGVTRTAVVNVLPVALNSVSVTPTTIKGTLTATATATLNGPAPAGGLVLQLSTSNSGVATTIPSITVPAGQRSIKFFVYTKRVSANTAVNVIVKQGVISRSTRLTVTP